MTSSVSQDILDEDLLLYIISLLFPCLLKNSVNKPIKKRRRRRSHKKSWKWVFNKSSHCSHCLCFPMYFSYYWLCFFTFLPFLVNSTTIPIPVLAHLSTSKYSTCAESSYMLLGFSEDCTEAWLKNTYPYLSHNNEHNCNPIKQVFFIFWQPNLLAFS